MMNLSTGNNGTPGVDRLQPQRFELKYILPEELSLPIRDFLSSYLELDEYGATCPNFAYPVHSIYLDSPDLALYQTTINGDKNRFKLRLRYYENAPNAPVFFEIKQRMNNTISKQRGGVRRESVPLLLAGHLPEPGHLISNDPKQFMALQNVCEKINRLRAEPKAHVAYLREAWLTPNDNSVRVTIDRDIRCEPETTASLSTAMRRPVYVFGKNVVLELKFTNRFPDWFGELVRIFGLTQCGAAKYVDGIVRYGETQDFPSPEYRGPAALGLLARAAGKNGR